MPEPRPWSIPGYAADQLVGDGPLGEVWTGRAFAGGTAITLECGPPVPPATLTALRAFGRTGPRHPHLWPARDVVGEPHRTVVVRDRAAAGSLATVLAHRGRLRPGELVTVLAPVAAALDHLHGRDLVHGAVVPERVLFDADGRPALAGTLVDRVLGAAERVAPELRDPALGDGRPTTATDVFQLATCGLLALGDRHHGVPAALLEVLRAAAHPDPVRRPTAADLAAAIAASCPAEPVQLLVPAIDDDPTGWAPTVPPEWRTATPPPADPSRDRTRDAARDRTGDPARDRARDSARNPARDAVGSPVVDADVEVGSHRRPSVTSSRGRRVALAVLVAGLLIVAGAVWFRLPRAEPRPVAGPPAASVTSVEDRWLRVVDGLDAVRAAAYERGDVGLLGRVWAPGGSLRADVAQLRALVATGCTARGVRHRFGGVTVLAVERERVRLRVTQWLPASQRLRGGQVVGAFAGTPSATVGIDLVATDDGWRLA